MNVTGNITIGGTSATLFSQELKVFDPDIVLGVRTDGSGNDASTDNTANHGGIAIASTEGTPLISLYDVGVGETNPATYKKFMWFKSGTFSGLGTDAWLSNYAIGIGSTQFPTGTRLAAGSVQFTENDLTVVRNINSSGIITASAFVGTATSTTNIPNLTGDVTSNNTTTTLASVNSNVGTYGDAGSIPSITVNAKGLVTGVTTVAPNNGQLSLGVSGTGLSGSATFTANQSGSSTFTVTSNATSDNTNNAIVSRNDSGGFSAGIVTATSFIKSGGTSSQFLKADGSVDSNTYLSSTSSGTNLTGIVTSITAGSNITISGSTGNVTIATRIDGGEFNTGITTSVYVSVTSGIGTAVSGLTTVQANNDIFRGPGIAYSFPSTSGKKYVIESIHITNTFSGPLYFTARHDFNGGTNVPMAQRVIIPYQGSLEYLYNSSNKIVANPSDILRFQAFAGAGSTATGIDGGLDAFITISEKNDTNYIGTGKTVSTLSGTEIFQATSLPAVVQSIRICNYNLNIDVDASISIYRGSLSSGVRLGYLAYNITIPKNSVVEIVDRSKYLAVNDSIIGSASADGISVFFAGKYIT